jgi:CHAT domain-containing protein
MEVEAFLSSLTTLSDDALRLDWVREHQTEFDAAFFLALKGAIEDYSSELEHNLQNLAYGFLAVAVVNDIWAEALLWRAWANILQFHERYEDSLEISKRAVAIYEEHGKSFDVAVARTVEVGVLGALERFDEAIELAHWIRPHFERAEFSLGEARLTGALARVYTAAWRLEEALPEYKRAYTLYQQLERRLDAAWVLHNLGSLANRMDQLDTAWQYFSQAYPAFTTEDDTLSMIKTQFNMARVRWRQARYEDALQHLAQARDHLEEIEGSPDKGYVDLFEARVRRHLHQPYQAEMLLRRALRLFDSLDRHLEAAETLVDLGHLLASAAKTERLIQGLSCLEQAEIRLQHLDVPLFKAWIQLEQGELLYRLERSDEAAARAEAAAVVFRDAELTLRLAQAQVLLGDCCWRWQPDAARRYYHAALATTKESATLIAVRSWQGLGRLALAAGDTETAETAYEQAVLLLEELRRALHSHRHQAGFLEDKQVITEGLLDALQQQANKETELLSWLERFKAAALAEMLVNQPPDHSIDETMMELLAEREEIASLLDQRLSSLQANDNTLLAQAPQRGPALAAYDARQTQDIATLRRQLQLFDERITQMQDPTNAWREGKTIEPRQIHNLLDEKSVLISYYAVKDRLYALSATHMVDDLKIHPLPTTLTEIERKWRQYYRYIMRTSGSLRTIQKRLSALHQYLITPLSNRLSNKERLVILPHRNLFQIPFSALYDAKQQEYLVETFTIQIAPSATVLAWCRERWANASGSLLVGYPGETGQIDYLPGVKQELETLRPILPEATTLFGKDATATNLLAQMPQKRIIHLAGHAYYESERPLESGMPLADGRWLRAADLYLKHGHLEGALVVLSGCETGKGRPTGSDVLGLTSAFLYAGATAIIAGLWKVDDDATVTFMTSFYRELLQGRETAKALRHAQLTLLYGTAYSAPYFWAPFSLSGDSRLLFP